MHSLQEYSAGSQVMPTDRQGEVAGGVLGFPRPVSCDLWQEQRTPGMSTSFANHSPVTWAPGQPQYWSLSC